MSNKLLASSIDVVLAAVRSERSSQDEKWGDQSHHPDSLWSLILLEEVGEVAKAILEKDEQAVTDELVQVAAVAVAWLEARI